MQSFEYDSVLSMQTLHNILNIPEHALTKF